MNRICLKHDKHPLAFWEKMEEKIFKKPQNEKQALEPCECVLYRHTHVNTCRTQAEADRGKWKLFPSMLPDVLPRIKFMPFPEHTYPRPELMFVRGG